MRRRPDPFDRMERMLDQMRQSMGDWDMGNFVFPGPIGTGISRSDINLSLESDEDGYVVFADLPGFEKNEIDLRFSNGTLSVSATRDVAEEDDLMIHHRRNHVLEEVQIPGTVKKDEISASYRNGVLEVRLPTTESVDDGSVISID